MKQSPLSKLTGQGLCEMSVARYMDNHVCLSKVQFNNEMDPFQPDFCSITSNSDHFGHRFSKEWAWDHPRWLTTYDRGWTWYRDLDYHVLITALCKIHVNNLKKCWIVQFVVVLFHKLSNHLLNTLSTIRMLYWNSLNSFIDLQVWTVHIVICIASLVSWTIDRLGWTGKCLKGWMGGYEGVQGAQRC
jgi:hypothetical protein